MNELLPVQRPVSGDLLSSDQILKEATSDA